MFLGMVTMTWLVEAYCEEIDRTWVPVVEEEALSLIKNPETSVDAAKLVGWLQAVASGNASPAHEPSSTVGGWVCKYRCGGEAVIIFELVEPTKLLLLRFGRAASTYPVAADLALAVRRTLLWRSRQGK